MSGEYFLIGKVLYKGQGHKGMSLSNIDAKMLSDLDNKFSEKIRSHCKEFFGVDGSPKIHVLTHWH